MEAQQHLSMGDIGRVILRRYRVVAAFAILGLAAGLYMFSTGAPAYRASSEVLFERQSGYSIVTAASMLGSATSIKQAQHFLDTDNYQQLARAVTTIAPDANVDLRDMATLDDISTVIQTKLLNSRLVTPVRIGLYNAPAPNLYSFQQARTLKEAPVLGKRMVTLAHMAMGGAFNLTEGWRPGRPGSSDHKVGQNLKRLASSELVTGLQALGVPDLASEEVDDPQDSEDTIPSKVTRAKVIQAANTIGILAELEAASDTDGKLKTHITDRTEATDVLLKAGEIMQSKFVGGLENGPGRLDWFKLSPAQKQAYIQTAGDALEQQKRKHPSKTEGVWDVSGKEVTDGSDIIGITQTAPTADEARRAANAMAAIMVWEDRISKVVDSEQSVRFLRPELAKAEKALRLTDDKLTVFRKKNRVVDAEAQLKSAAEYAADLESQLGEAGAAIREAKAALAKTETQLGGTKKVNIFPTIKQNPIVEGIKADLIKAETELEGLRAKGFTDEWPDVMSAKAQVAYLHKALNQQVHDSVERQYMADPVHYALLQKAADLGSGEVGLEARQEAVSRLLGSMNGKFASLPDVQAALVRLTRDQARAEAKYTALFGRLIDATLTGARHGNARVLSVALNSGEKVAPRRKTIYIAVLVGIFVGCLCALALSATDVHLRTANDVQKELKLPVLAHLPAIPAGNTLVVEAMPASALTEAFRGLRSTIRFIGGDTPIRTLAVTSVRRADVKSAVAANLSASLAQAGLVITAIDSDLRRPGLADYFGSVPGAGLAEALAGSTSLATARRSTRIPGLYTVSAGTPPSNPAELLESGHIGSLITGISDGNDMVVVDTPPAGAVSDAVVIAAAVDATVLVIEAGGVEPDAARAAIAKLTQSAQAHMIGVVLVGGDAPINSDYDRYARIVAGKPARADRPTKA